MAVEDEEAKQTPTAEPEDLFKTCDDEPPVPMQRLSPKQQDLTHMVAA